VDSNFRGPDGAPRMYLQIRPKPEIFRVPEPANPRVKTRNRTRNPKTADTRPEPDPLPSIDRLLFVNIYLPALSLSLQCHNAVSLLVFVNQGWVVGTPSPILLRHPFLVWLSWTQQVYLTKKEQTSTSHVFGDLLGVLE